MRITWVVLIFLIALQAAAPAGARAYERPITKVICLNHAPRHDNKRQWQGNRSFVLP